jgi:uncharacterized protein with ParB-like and HNH nuclease domain
MNINTNVITVGDLLKDGKIYAVPIFQRSYSWEKGELTDFWNDIVGLCEEAKKTSDYFIGSMVFTPHNEKGKVQILDGQQRFATFLLFLAALKNVLETTQIKGSEDWIDEFERIIFKRDTVTRLQNPKLELNREDKIFFDDVVIRGVLQDPRYESHKLITNAYNYLKKQITAGISERKEKFVEAILNALLNRFVMIKIKVDSDINAHTIFETLNDRGLDLSVADLVKNYVFSVASSSGHNLDDIIQIWKEMVDQIGDHNVTTFLRHYWISSVEQVSKDDLYKALKSHINTRNVKQVMQELSQEAVVYANLINPTHEFWGDDEIEMAIENLGILKAQQVYILVLALYCKFGTSPIVFKKLLEVLTSFTFRYNTICGLDPKELESLYSKLAISVRKGKIEKSQVVKELHDRSPSKNSFLSSFDEFETKNSKLSRYILVSINDHLLSKIGRREEQTRRDSTVNLEHIIPKKPDAEWKHFFKVNNIDYEKLIYKIGNMTILLEEYNRKLANKFIDKKQEMYKKSTLPINNYWKKHNSFGPTQVSKRQKDFGKIAESLWIL